MGDIIRHFMGFGFKRLAVMCVVLQLTACSLDSNEGAGAGTGIAIASVSWIPPTEREDGEGLSMAEIAGYRIYYGTSEGSYPNQVDISDSTVQQATVTITSGIHFFVMTTYDVDGRESDFSSPALKIQI
jgi:hypothetical protein